MLVDSSVVEHMAWHVFREPGFNPQPWPLFRLQLCDLSWYQDLGVYQEGQGVLPPTPRCHHLCVSWEPPPEALGYHIQHTFPPKLVVAWTSDKSEEDIGTFLCWAYTVSMLSWCNVMHRALLVHDESLAVVGTVPVVRRDSQADVGGARPRREPPWRRAVMPTPTPCIVQVVRTG